MKKMNLLGLSILALLLISMVGLQAKTTSPVPVQAKKTASKTLQIYTYESLMSDLYYNIEGNFSAYSGINVNITRFSDANQLVTELTSGAKPDIVIGIDNALINLFNVSNYFVQYDNSSVLNNINPELMNNLDPSHYLIPYDYGVIALTYQNSLVNSSNYPFLGNNFTFNDLVNSTLASKIVLENPKISSTGLGFLLSTIATYGDSANNVTGVLGQNWTNFWKTTGKKFTVTKSWNDAYAVFSDAKGSNPIMVSYLTDPAYNYCLYNDTSTSTALTTLSNGSQAGWFQIEGMGIVKGSPNQAAAQEFMNWFLSEDVQNKIPESNWMFPANVEATVPACFSAAGVPNLKTIVPLNNYITTTQLKTYLSSWMNQWELTVNSRSLPGFSLPVLSLVLPVLVLIGITRKKRTQ